MLLALPLATVAIHTHLTVLILNKSLKYHLAPFQVTQARSVDVAPTSSPLGKNWLVLVRHPLFD